MLRFMSVFIAFFVWSSTAALAAPVTPDDVSGLFCDAINDPAMYDKYHFEAYKMLIGGEKGWIYRTESDLRKDFSLNAESRDNLRDLNKAFKAKGIKLVMLLLPTRGLVHSEYLKPADVKKYGFDVDDAWESYWSMIDQLHDEDIAAVGIARPPAGADFFYKRDHHWNATGAAIGAKTLADYIKKLPEYQGIDKMAFVSKENGSMDFEGVSKKVFKKLCDTDQPTEPIVVKYTERVDESDGQDDLFGDTKEPAIALLGTSNSTPEPSFANFAGFLKEDLSADILNMSVSGGGLDTAMLGYLSSDHYKTSPAKIAIWEVPSYYDIANHDTFFREAIPAVYGACEVAEASAPGITVDDKTTIALTRLAEKDIYGDDYYLSLSFDKTVSKPFTVNLLYQKNRDKFRFAHSGRYPQDKEFFVRLDKDIDTPLEKVILNVPKEIIGSKVDAKICKIGDTRHLAAGDDKKNGEPSIMSSVIKLFKRL